MPLNPSVVIARYICWGFLGGSTIMIGFSGYHPGIGANTARL